MGKKIIFLFSVWVILLFPVKHADASVYDNAYTYYGKYGSESKSPARLNENDGYIYFCSKGLTASTSTQYRTVGYTITLTAGNKKDSVEVKLGGSYVKEVSQVKKDGYTYVLRRAKLSLLQTLFNGNSAITWNQIYCNKNTYKFDAIMTVVENGKQLCGTVNESSNYRTISADTNSYLFRNASGIKKARKWTNPSDLNSFFDKSVVFEPVSYIKTRDAYAEGESGNVFYDNGMYYVRQNSVVRLSFESYFEDADAANPKFHPNYNMYNVTGWGDNQKYYTMQKNANGECSGIIKDGTGTEKPLGIVNTVTAVTTGYNDCKYAFRSMARFNFYTPDGGVTYVNTEGRVYYDYLYPGNLSINDNLCDKSSDHNNTISLISDAKAPEIYLPKYVSVIADYYIPVTASDGGSGIRSLALYRSDGQLIRQVNYSGRNTTVSSYSDFRVINDNYKYFIRAVDNVGNVYDSDYVVFSKPVAHTIDAYIAGGVNGYNSSVITANVYGGNSEIAELIIMSDYEKNPTEDRIVFVNQSVVNHTLASGKYMYRYDVNPMYMLTGKPDGIYNIEVISGGKYVGSDPAVLVLKKDKTSPLIDIRSYFSEEKWNRYDLSLKFDVSDNFSGVNRVWAISGNGELKGKLTNTAQGVSAQYTINTEGENSIYLNASDMAGNVKTRKIKYLIDRTPPKCMLSGTFTGLDSSNDVWLNKDKMKGEIYVSDELSGMSEKQSKYILYDRGSGSTREVEFNNLFDLNLKNKNTAILSFSDKFIDTMVSSKRSYMVEAEDVAGNLKTVRLYLNIDFDVPEADYDCSNPWNEKTYRGNVHITDEHSGVASVEVYVDDECKKSVYDINKNEYILNLSMEEYEESKPDITIKITDVAGNVYDYPLIKGEKIKLSASVSRIDNKEQPVFNAGENASLTIEYSGDADTIKVFFPEELLKYNPELNREYDVSDRKWIKIITGFIIPLKTDNGHYKVKVAAYKGDKEYAVYPPFEVYGCITSRFRTRIR